MTEYYFDIHDDDWIGVPSAFPEGPWESPAAWAAGIAEAAIPDDAEARERFAAIAEQVASTQPQNVNHTFWFAPIDGRAMGVAYLAVAQIDGPLPSLEAIATLDIDSVTPVQILEFPSGPFGRVVQSAATIRLTDIGEAPEGEIAGSLRVVGVRGDLLFMLNAIDEDLAVLGFMQEPMRELFEAVVFADTEEEKDAAARVLGLE